MNTITKNTITPTTRVSPKHQITIPKEVFDMIGLEIGDFLDVEAKQDKIILTPKKLVPKSQAWFWTKEWQKKEKEADNDIAKGKVSKIYEDVDDMIKDLES